jgi:hypothetical protein
MRRGNSMKPVRLPVGTPVIYEKGEAEYHLVVGLIQDPATGAMQAVQMEPGDNLDMMLHACLVERMRELQGRSPGSGAEVLMQWE